VSKKFPVDDCQKRHLIAALQQIKVVCEDKRLVKDIGPSERMTLFFIHQISEQALRAPVSTAGKP